MGVITGLYSYGKNPEILEQGSHLMEQLRRFPSDSSQAWHNEDVFLGCHAQWITPESVGEKIPYYEDESQLVITADAIIDNRDELLDRLHVQGSLRKDITDTQLILLSYQKWGDKAISFLVGDFAFMIWDARNRRLYGARDFSGARTLYYSANHDQFAFCTTIQPLLSLSNNQKKLNEQWLAEFLAIPGMVDSVDVDSTIYQGIKQLPPSHTISVRDGRVELFRYSSFILDKPLVLKSNSDYEEAFRAVLETAVLSRIRTHRGVGAHLSGGLDSSSVVSFAAPALLKANKKLSTYSYVPVDGFADWTAKHRMADETPYIQSVVQHVGNINDQYLSFEGKSPLSEIDEWLDILEMPYKFYANSYWLKGIYELAQQQGIGVLLNGLRGNMSISWGPVLPSLVSLFRKFQWIRFAKEVHLYGRNTGVGRSRILKQVRNSVFSLGNTKPFIGSALINPEFARRTSVYEKLLEYGMDIHRTPSMYEYRSQHFKQLFHWNGTGTCTTKLSLRYSLWDRDPTNDLRVVQFCLSVPDEQYMQDGYGRSLIRRSTKGYLPDAVRLNQNIHGIQGADGVHRMAASWSVFIGELERMSEDTYMSQLLNIDVIKRAIACIKDEPRSEYVYQEEFSHLMRSLIVYRFVKKINA